MIVGAVSCDLPAEAACLDSAGAKRQTRSTRCGATSPGWWEIKMSIGVFLMVLFAAVVHASWNALVKSDEDRPGLIRVMFLSQFAFSPSLVPFVALPARESWPYLCTSAVLGAGYMVFLNWAYRVGDLSQVYPFARGIAPLIVAIVSAAFLGEQISEAGKVGVVLIALGIASLALTRGAAGLREPRPVYLSSRAALSARTQ